ncbi:MAG: hypothetical protein HZB40_04840 [Rhodocyclales bacterium]|nr:hypothetical protein [Rhodocyclales bacterium]
MKRFIWVALLAVASLVVDAAHARKTVVAVAPVDDYVNKPLPDHATVWHCWYDDAVSILCRLGETARTADVATGREAPAADVRLPRIVKDIWQRPEKMVNAVITIPLHAIPFDMALTGQLADAAMCAGARAPCGVIFARNERLLAGFVQARERQIAARNATQIATAD